MNISASEMRKLTDEKYAVAEAANKEVAKISWQVKDVESTL